MGGNAMCQRLFLVLMLLAANAFGADPASPTKVLTLEQAVALALENNRSIKSAELEVSKQEDSLAIARTRRLPKFDATVFGSMLLNKVDFTFKKGDFGTFPSGEPNPSTDVKVTTPRKFNTFALMSVDQPLSQLFRIKLNIQSAKVSSQIASEDLRAKRQSVASDVKSAYFAVLQTQSSLEALEQSIKLYHELDRVTGDYVLQQVALKSQGMEVKARLAKAEYDALKLRNTVRSQKERLNQLLGQPLDTDFVVIPMPQLTNLDIDLAAAQARAREQRPELRQAILKRSKLSWTGAARRRSSFPISVCLIATFHLSALT